MPVCDVTELGPLPAIPHSWRVRAASCKNVSAAMRFSVHRQRGLEPVGAARMRVLRHRERIAQRRGWHVLHRLDAFGRSERHPGPGYDLAGRQLVDELARDCLVLAAAE